LDLFECELAGLIAVVKIGGGVRKLVSCIDQLRFERGAAVEQIFRELGEFVCPVVSRVLDDPLANFKCEVQSPKRCVTNFKIFHDPQRMQVVIEKQSMLTHDRVEGTLSRMAERWMPDVVR